MTDDEKQLADAAGAFVVALVRALKGNTDSGVSNIRTLPQPEGAAASGASPAPAGASDDPDPALQPMDRATPLGLEWRDLDGGGVADASGFVEGERIIPDGCGACSIQYIQSNADGQTRWHVLDPQGQSVRKVWGRERAEQLARELHQNGTINVARVIS